MTLEKLYKCQAATLADSIDSVQLRQLLRIENGKLFDQKICDELVDHFGEAGVINFDNFEDIWSHLQKMRSQFDKFAFEGMLSGGAFKSVLEQVAGQKIKTSFIKKLLKFYKFTVTFDVFVHSVHHIRIMSDKFNLQKTEHLMDEFMRSVYYAKPSAPSESDIISFDNAYCTYI